MKTIEEKAKAYDEALERAKNFIENGDEGERTIAESIFAGIMEESEDERIRNEIIAFVEQAIHRGGGTPILQEQEDRWIAWLEKQGEQKPANKVESKFEIGDWVVYDHRAYQVVELPKEGYINLGLRGNGKIEFAPSTYCKHWTIQDAKDGDVLVASDGSIFLFKGAIDCACKHYVALTADGVVEFNEGLEHLWETSTAVHPATKEQRDLLFSKMKEAGYEWDAEKKELKKIEQKSSWSEEDEKMLRGIINDFSDELDEETDENEIEIITNKISFLKSLEPHPIHKWNRKDNRIRLEITNYLECQKREKPTRTDILNKWIAWIANLDPQGKQESQWKPSDEQMKALEEATNKQWDVDGDALWHLYQDLKKLREE